MTGRGSIGSVGGALLAVVAALLWLAVPASAQDDAYFLNTGANPSTEALVVTPDHVITGQLDGRVTAIERATGTVAWEWQQPFAAGRVLDMVTDGQRLFVAVSDLSRQGAEPVYALEMDGSVAWVMPAAEAARLPTEVYRLAIDAVDPDFEDRLYLGMARGHLGVINRTDGRIVQVEGVDLLRAPSVPDAPVGKCTAVQSESGIYALAVHDHVVWAARNFGGEDKRGQCEAPLLTSELNRLMRLHADRLDAPSDLFGDALALLPAMDPIPNTNRVARPGVLDIWVDPFESDASTESVYFAGAATGDAGFIAWIGFPRNCQDACPLPAALAVTHADDAGQFPGGTVLLESGAKAIGASVHGDASFVYASTWQNEGGFPATDSVATGWAFKLQKRNLQDAGAWSHVRPDGTFVAGRSMEAGDGNEIDASGDRVVIGHGAVTPPFPSVGAIQHRFGSLIVEVPKDDRPVGLLMLPATGETITRTFPIAFRNDAPSGRLVDMRLEVRHDALLGPGWRAFEPVLFSAAPANDYRVSNNVDFSALPDGDGYRIRMRVSDGPGRSFLDQGTGTFMVDKTPPAIQAVLPADGAIVTTCQPRFELQGFDATSGVDRFASGLFIDGRGYPYLDYSVDEAGRVTGFVLDMAKLDPNMGDPQRPQEGTQPPGCLAQGTHVFEARLVDRAGNFAFLRRTITVDSQIAAPQLAPAAEWTHHARQVLTMQFREPVRVLESTSTAAGATLVHLAQHPDQNPLGDRLVLTPSADLEGVLRWTVTVQDMAGNVLGPIVHEIKVDRQAPSIEPLSPAPDSVATQRRPVIAASFGDTGGSGIRPDRVSVQLDGLPAPGFLAQSDGVVFVPGVDLSSGRHEVLVRVEDVAGNVAMRTWRFDVDREAPEVSLQVVLPAGQTAVKRGDTVGIVLRAQDHSGLQHVGLNVEGLDPSRTQEVTPQPTGTSGERRLDVRVEEAGSKLVQIAARVVDAGGQERRASVPVLVDNQPPQTFMPDLPRSVGAQFTVAWQDVPTGTGGSAVSLYRLERQMATGTWEPFAELQGKSHRVSYAGDPIVMRFRVTAVDGAGNVQPVPSNAVETSVSGDPFQKAVLPARLQLGQNQTVTVSLLEAYRERVTGVDLLVERGDEVVMRLPLQPAGDVYTANLPTGLLQVGEYTARFVATARVEGETVLLAGSSLPVAVAGAQPLDEALRKDAPGPVPWLPLAAGLWWAVRRRPLRG